MARGMFFVIATFVLLGVSILSEQQRKLKSWHIGAFLLLALVRVFFDGIPSQEWYNFWFSCAGFIYVFCGVLLFYLVYCYAGEVKQFITPIIIVALINFVLVSFQLFDIDLIWARSYAITGIMDTQSQLGQYSAMALPLMFIHPILTIIPLFTLFVSKSVSPIISCYLGLYFLAYSFKKWKLIFCLTVLGAFLVIACSSYIENKFTCSRPAIWVKTVQEIAKKPFLGHGYRTFDEKVLETNNKLIGSNELRRAHNDYLHTAQELGIPIIFVFFLFVIRQFKKLRIDMDKTTYLLAASVIIALINMSGQTMARYASVMGTFIVLFALLSIKLETQ